MDDPLVGQPIEPHPPAKVNGGEEYQISNIEDSRVYQNQLQHLIWWTGYDSLTW